jgi:hypothetical protein
MKGLHPFSGAILLVLLWSGIFTGCRSVAVSSQEPSLLIEIWVNPGFLNLQNQGQTITIYTKLAYSDVLKSNATLNGMSIGSWSSNKDGSYSVKISDSTLRALSIPSGTQEFTVTLTGEKKDGTVFTGSAQLTIFNNPSTQ